MSSLKFKRMIQKNLMVENNYVAKKMLLREGTVEELNSKRQNIITYLEELKNQNGVLYKGTIQGYIDDMKSIDVNNVCTGTNLSSEMKTKLDEAKDGISRAKGLGVKDKNNVIPKIEQEIPFIENYCSTQPTDNKEKKQPDPTGDQYYKSQQEKNQTPQQGGLIRTTSSQSQNVQQPTKPTNIPDSERKPKFMDELDRLNTTQKYTKQDIIDYVKSKVQIRTT
jgi:hypothetical protein